jgi:hypothetical protein
VATDSNGEGDSSNKVIALAGIAATAVVGIAGAGASWLISREDRNNERALARGARVYDRRAAVYLDALSLLRSLDARVGADAERVNGNPHRFHFVVGRPSRQTEPSLRAQLANGEKRIRVRLLAYGSDAGYSTFDAAIRALNRADGDLIPFRLYRVTPFYRQDVGTFFAKYLRFTTIVHRELGGG